MSSMNTWLTNQLAEAHVNEMLRTARAKEATHMGRRSSRTDAFPATPALRTALPTAATAATAPTVATAPTAATAATAPVIGVNPAHKAHAPSLRLVAPSTGSDHPTLHLHTTVRTLRARTGGLLIRTGVRLGGAGADPADLAC